MLKIWLKICRMPPPEPCKGLKEKTDATPPAPGKDELDFMGEKAIGQAYLFSLSGLPKILIFPVCMQFVDSIMRKGISC